MAKLMVMIDVPEHDYDSLSVAMQMHRTLKKPRVDFVQPTSKDGLEQVAVDRERMKTDDYGNFVFELIGVRP